MPEPSIAIVGGGIGGLTAALALRRLGMEPVVLEQTGRYGRVGADINLTPNAVKALDGLGLGPTLRERAGRPTHRISRVWDSGAETSRLAMSNSAEERYGSPQLTLHRADLLAALDRALPETTVELGQRVVGVEPGETQALLRFENGASRAFDLVIGADGIHSAVRTSLFGAEHPRFTGVVAFRAVVPGDRLRGLPNVGAFTKWWGWNQQTQIVTFPLGPEGDVFVFATIGQETWTHESWTTHGNVDELRTLYATFHPEARALLDACDSVLKTALYERDPMPSWSKGRAVLLGDACHPMLPFMAQGAGSAIEDAVVLARCLARDPARPKTGMAAYETARRERTARIQLGSRANTWLKDGGDADWVYGYDAWTVAID
jgi:salicylate hydroxylase